jgi:hypothetical protein
MQGIQEGRQTEQGMQTGTQEVQERQAGQGSQKAQSSAGRQVNVGKPAFRAGQARR